MYPIHQLGLYAEQVDSGRRFLWAIARHFDSHTDGKEVMHQAGFLHKFCKHL